MTLMKIGRRIIQRLLDLQSERSIFETYITNDLGGSIKFTKLFMSRYYTDLTVILIDPFRVRPFSGPPIDFGIFQYSTTIYPRPPASFAPFLLI